MKYKFSAPSAFYSGIEFGPYDSFEKANDDLCSMIPACTLKEKEEIAKRCIVRCKKGEI